MTRYRRYCSPGRGDHHRPSRPVRAWSEGSNRGHKNGLAISKNPWASCACTNLPAAEWAWRKGVSMRLVVYLGASALGLARSCLAQESSATPAASTPAHIIVVRARALIDGTNAPPLRDPEIVIRGNRILEVHAAGTKPPPAGAQVIDLGAVTVLPGLIDCHTHIFLQGELPSAGGYDVQLLKFPASYRAARAVVAARRALEQGFTTIRDVETEGAGYGDVGIKQAINEGYIPGPRMFVSTRSISSTGGYNLEGYAPEIEVPKSAQLIDGPVQGRKTGGGE